MTGNGDESIRARVQDAVAQRLSAQLVPLGFVVSGAHAVRRRGEGVEVVELQHAVYGPRITANLGLSLESLGSVLRWLPTLPFGPHAHECARWSRVSLAEAGGQDRWWTYESDSVESAADALVDRIVATGVPWLEREGTQDAWLRHGLAAVSRTRSPRCPEGGFFELRLMSAVHAWRSEMDLARARFREAAALWPDERARLAAARAVYARRADRPVSELPDLLAELQGLIGPTTAGRSMVEREPMEPSAPSPFA